MIQTTRLILRPFNEGDLAAFSKINADPEVMRYFPAPYDAGQTAEMLIRFADKQERFGYAFSAVERKSDGVLLGMAGLSRLEDGAPFAPCTEIGWRLTPSVWGKGYASEAALAWISHGFTALGIDKIYSYTPRLNLPSEKVMRRIGMRRAEALDFDHPVIPDGDALKPMVVYRMGREEFEAGVNRARGL
ncbi:MAG: GNAT family N-acetyltransferase [Marinosulfonomonas sp.]|nr:GNAT family N-acetyltransferase [Marinosulfonomonas sp.]